MLHKKNQIAETLFLLCRTNTIYFNIMIIQKELIAYEEYFTSTEGIPSKGFLILKTGERIEIPVTDLNLCNLIQIYRN
ncbi:MAG: hypothetical protein JWQ25_939 [Daejeonella sp.]|nr:hypothetical protein [Daejeonella sp.]